MNNKAIPIVIATDVNLERQAQVLIASILDSADMNTEYTIIVLVDEKVQREKLREAFAECSNLNLNFHIINEDLLNSTYLNLEGITAFTYARLYIPSILKEYDKCLYLDVDVLVDGDLTALLNWDIENYAVAGVKDGGAQYAYRERQISADVVGGDESLEKYMNAGVLLMNLKKMRETGIAKQMIEMIGTPLLYQDQDIINRCCCSSKLLLPTIYNFRAEYYRRKDAAKFNFYDQTDIEMMVGEPIIFHYAGGGLCRPWNFTKGRAAKLWWKIANKTLSADEYKSLYAVASKNELQMSICKMIEFCVSKKVVIWGYTKLAEKLCDMLLDQDINVICFGDNNDAKHDLVYEGVPVKSFCEIQNDVDKEVCFIIASQKAYVEIEQFLHENGYKNTFHHKVKPKTYYIQLDEQFYEEEIKEIEWIERVPRENFDEQLIEKYCLYQWDLYNDGKTSKC